MATSSSNSVTTAGAVPSWDGDPCSFESYCKAARWFRAGLKDNEKANAAARLWTALRGPARDVVKDLDPEEFERPEGVQALLDVLANAPLGRTPIPDAYAKIRTYDEIQRRQGEVIGEYIVREDTAFKDMMAAIRRVRQDRQQRRRGDRNLDVMDGIAEDYEENFHEEEIRGYKLLHSARLSVTERQMILAGTTNDTQYTAVVTQLRAAWEDPDLRARDKGGW